MIIRQIQETDFAQVQELENVVWGGEGASIEQIESRWRTFPQGSIVAELNTKKIVGYAVAQRVNQLSASSWSEQTDQGMITETHREDGIIAYGVNMSVLKKVASLKISHSIIDHYHKIFIREGRCSILALGSRLPGFAKWKLRTSGTVRQYLCELSGSRSIDPELRLYQKNGFELLWEIPGYFPDEDSGNYGAMIIQRQKN